MAVRYGWTVEIIESLDVVLFHDLAIKILEENRVEAIQRRWLQLIPAMSMGFIKEMSFEDYLERNSQTFDMRPAEEILKEVEEIRKELGG